MKPWVLGYLKQGIHVIERSRKVVHIHLNECQGDKMKQVVIYSVELLEITNDIIIFRNYYFPFGSRRVKLFDIDTLK